MWIAGLHEHLHHVSTKWIDMPSCLNCQRSWLIWFLCFILHEINLWCFLVNSVSNTSNLQLLGDGDLQKHPRTSGCDSLALLKTASGGLALATTSRWTPTLDAPRWAPSPRYSSNKIQGGSTSTSSSCWFWWDVLCHANANLQLKNLPKTRIRFNWFNLPPTAWRSSPLGHGRAIWLSKSSMSCTSTTKGPRSLGCPWRSSW